MKKVTIIFTGFDALQRVEFLIEKKYPELILLSKNYENKEYVSKILDGLNLNYIFDDNKTYLVEILDITTQLQIQVILTVI